jgi:protein ImuB
MLWIALYLPQLPLDLAYRHWPDAMRDKLDSSAPIVVTAARHVGWANPCALDKGVLIGMLESSAHARTAELMSFERDHAAEERAVIEAALWALHFTPQVGLMAGGIVLDVTASVRLFGGHADLINGLRAGVMELGMQPQLATAPTAMAAWLLAQHADGTVADSESCAAMLDGLPVSLLQSVQAHLDTLRTIGCERIGQLRQLPRTGITRRFGAAVLTELDTAYGIEPEAHAWYEPPVTFHARLELPARVDSTEALLFAARRLLMQMTGWLVARHAGVSHFSLLLHHETMRSREHATTTVTIALGNASRDLAHLLLLLQEHLAKVTLKASVIELSLQADQIVQLAAPNSELFSTVTSRAESLGRLVERLSSRLGDAAISRLQPFADHRPERCSVTQPISAAAVSRNARNVQNDLLADEFPARPNWLLEQPLPLLIQQDQPFYKSPLRLLTGPERIESGWWDDALATRDYFIACNDANLMLWIYLERPIAGTDKSGWFLHGFFA